MCVFSLCFLVFVWVVYFLGYAPCKLVGWPILRFYFMTEFTQKKSLYDMIYGNNHPQLERKLIETIKNWYCAARKPRSRLETLAKWWNLKTLAVVRIFFIFYFTKQYDTQRKREREIWHLFFCFCMKNTKNTKQETVKKNADEKKCETENC